MAERFLRFSHLGLTPQGLEGRTSATKINAAIQKQMQNIWVEAAQKFILSLASETLVETGESYGALIAAAGEVGLALTLPSVRNRKRPQLALVGGAPIPGTMRSLGSGIARGTGFFQVGFTNHHYEFTFSFSVFQAALHDAGAGANGPTSAADASGRALAKANKFASAQFKKVIGPMVFKWLSTGKVESIRV